MERAAINCAGRGGGVIAAPGGQAGRMRVMMIGAYPKSPGRIDGGVAAAMTYLSDALAGDSRVELTGVRITWGNSSQPQESSFPWTIVDLPIERLGLTTLYWRQKRRLAELIRTHKPDIIHGQGTDVAGYLAIQAAVPSVVTVHGLLAECARFQTDPISRWRAQLVARLTETRTVRRATDLIAISPYVRRYYVRDIAGHVYDIPNAVPRAYFSVLRAPEKGRLLYAGRIANGKGLIELLRAVARNPRYVTRLVLAGATTDPAYETTIRNLAHELGISQIVDFVGLLDEPSLLREFGRADVLVLPSFQETAPMVIQQAMAAGLGVVASNVGGIPFQIQHGFSGLMFGAGDVEALSAHFARLGNEPRLSRSLGERARQDAEVRFRADAIARATIDVYESILTARRVRGPSP